MTEMKVEYVDHMGSDLSVVNAARVSFDKRSNTFSEGDKKLLQYLASHNHWTPFAHTSISFRIKAPIFVARQLAKHQVGLVWNEVSRRYVDKPPEFYTPSVWRGRPTNGAKQGSDETVEIPHEMKEFWGVGYTELDDFHVDCGFYYDRLIQSGVAPEMARMVLPQSTMTEWIWTGSLIAFNRVCNLRLDKHAQKETKEIAIEIADVCNNLFPESWEALRNAKNQ